MNIHNMHRYVEVVNAHRREIQVLDSMMSHSYRPELQRMLRGMEAYFNVSLSTNNAQNNKWPDSLLSMWPIVVKDTPQQEDGYPCGLFVIKNMECWMGSNHSEEFDQAYINGFRKKLPSALVNSLMNKLRKQCISSLVAMDNIDWIRMSLPDQDLLIPTMKSYYFDMAAIHVFYYIMWAF